MKILLIDIWESNIPSLGLGYLVSYARKYGGYSDIFIAEEEKEALFTLSKKKIDIVGFKTVTPNYNRSLNLARKIKEKYNIPVLIGGPHISSMPDRLDKTCDVGIIAEGEETFLELLNLFQEKNKFKPEELAKIKGISYHDKGTVKVTERRMPIQDLDKIPPPAIELFDTKKYFKPGDILCTHRKYVGTSIITSRGCPYKCIYCQAASQWGRTRFHSAKYVADEIKNLYDKYKVNGIAIVDDLFIANKKRVREITDLLEKEGLLGKIDYLVSGRANLIDDEILALLKKLGVVQISLGFETGSGRLLKYLKKDTVTIEQNRNAAKLIKKYGIRVYGLFMMGSPTETREEMYQTIEFFKSLDIDVASISITSPLPGTELWDELYKKGKIDYNADWDTFVNPLYKPEKQIYVNELVPHDEFVKIYKKFRDLMIARSFKGGESIFTFEMFIKAMKHPKIALGTLNVIIKSKLKDISGRKK